MYFQSSSFRTIVLTCISTEQKIIITRVFISFYHLCTLMILFLRTLTSKEINIIGNLVYKKSYCEDNKSGSAYKNNYLPVLAFQRAITSMTQSIL